MIPILFKKIRRIPTGARIRTHQIHMFPMNESPKSESLSASVFFHPQPMNKAMINPPNGKNTFPDNSSMKVKKSLPINVIGTAP